MKKRLIISGTGCALADNLYTDINFSTSLFQKYLSKENADGGLSPGRLVFTEEFEKFAGKDLQNLIQEITNGQAASGFNIGGPSIVSLINAAQLLVNEDVKINFYGAIGKDETGNQIIEGLKPLNINTDNYKQFNTLSAFTDVLSDPDYDEGRGERIFINNIGAAWQYKPTDLNDEFFKSDITAFGGTALVPNIHDSLTELLQKAKDHDCTTIVNTVYDFRNEKLSPNKKWPLVENDGYKLIDLLIMDKEEALKISGQNNIDKAINYFTGHNAKAVIITQGPDPVIFYSSGDVFKKSRVKQLPVFTDFSKYTDYKSGQGDTTGCGDNFVGGVLASIVFQMKQGIKNLDISKSVELGIASGAFACTYFGGVYHEKKEGEKITLTQEFLKSYKER